MLCFYWFFPHIVRICSLVCLGLAIHCLTSCRISVHILQPPPLPSTCTSRWLIASSHDRPRYHHRLSRLQLKRFIDWTWLCYKLGLRHNIFAVHFVDTMKNIVIPSPYSSDHGIRYNISTLEESTSNKDKLTNYRPISNLYHIQNNETCCKILANW